MVEEVGHVIPSHPRWTLPFHVRCVRCFYFLDEMDVPPRQPLSTKKRIRHPIVLLTRNATRMELRLFIRSSSCILERACVPYACRSKGGASRKRPQGGPFKPCGLAQDSAQSPGPQSGVHSLGRRGAHGSCGIIDSAPRPYRGGRGYPTAISCRSAEKLLDLIHPAPIEVIGDSDLP